jgi:uncharacterized protein DUF6916
MSTSRRDFIRKSAVVALAAGVSGGLTKRTAAAGIFAGETNSTLTKAAFAANLNTDFFIRNGGTRVKTKLVEVSDLKKPASVPSSREGFSLLFRGDRSKTLQQNTYVIEHQKLGTFSFLVVPVRTQDNTALFYEAVVNRLYT